MTLENLLALITEIGLNDRLVNFAACGNSVYDINSYQIKNYPLLFVSPTGMQGVSERFVTYTLTIFYIDRLLTDNSNQIQIHSIAIDALKNIINKIEAFDDVIEVEDNYNITLFTENEKFSDVCNGAFATIRVKTLNNSTCGVE